MGAVRKYGRHRAWTQEEIEKLRELSEEKTKSGIAKELGRSCQSVNSKRIELGIASFTAQTDKLNMRQIAELVGVDGRTIGKVWVKHGLRFRKVGCYKVISESRLLSFMKEHPELWKASKCDYHFFCRHKWFRERLENEKSGIDQGTHYQNMRFWTGAEISHMQMLKRRGLTHEEIAKELGRTKRAVDHMNIRINREREEVKCQTFILQ